MLGKRVLSVIVSPYEGQEASYTTKDWKYRLRNKVFTVHFWHFGRLKEGGEGGVWNPLNTPPPPGSTPGEERVNGYKSCKNPFMLLSELSSFNKRKLT